MDMWVCQWHPDYSEEECVLIKTPHDLWSTVQAMLRDYPDENITITSAE